ncbi:MAG: FHA domain-containing protein [Myxococcales bacterium]|nr:MAG: FHA domain-containing protein [Myxococcales bacterium]
MRTPTPRAMPAIVLDTPPRASAPLGPAPAPLMGPVMVRCGTTECELRVGSLLIGRGTECDLVLEDPLVSRLHARIQVEAEGVKVEDLYSTNGVYLNGERVMQARLLHQGDHLFIGNHDVTFVEIRTDPAPATSVPPSSFPYHREPATRPNITVGAPDIPITARADALDLLGNLARRLANDVKAEQAPRMLGPHLQGILRGASAGLVVPAALCEIASEYAVDLAHWTTDPSWLNYVVELHLVTKRLMSATTVTALQRSERWVGAIDRRRLEYYVNSFAQGQSTLAKDERARLATLRRLLKKK